jgi:putative ABC transport system ATP-binding protein
VASLTVAGAASAIDARDLYRFYHSGDDDETLALRGVSLTVEPGEMIAVVGPSGSGKSTLLACLAGLDDPDGGAVHVAGERMSRRPEAVRARIRARGIGILLQSGNLFDHLSITENIRAAQALVPGAHRSPAELLDMVGLADKAGSRPSHLSGGEAARAGIAVALACRPHVLLADEPTGEVDAGNEHVVLRLLETAADQGAAVVVVTHSDRVAASATRIVRLVDGVVTDE